MNKVYKGYELLKAIADGEIKEESRFRIKTLWNGSYCINSPIAIVKYKDIVYEKEEQIPAWTIINSEFELIEDEPIDIDNIEETDVNIAKHCSVETRIIDNTIKLNKILQWAKQKDKEIKSIKEKI